MSFDASMMQSLQLFMNLRQQYGEDSLKRLLESTSQMPTPPTFTPDHENKQHSLEVTLCFSKLMVKDCHNDNDDDIGDTFTNEEDIVMDDNHFTDECDEDN